MSLLEVVTSTLIITILAAGMFGAFIGAKFILNRELHRIQAFDFAREAQDRLRANYSYADSQMSNRKGHEEAEIGPIIKGGLTSLGAVMTYDVSEPYSKAYKEVTVRVTWDYDANF